MTVGRCLRWFFGLLLFFFIVKDPVAAAHVTHTLILTMRNAAEQSGAFLNQALDH